MFEPHLVWHRRSVKLSLPARTFRQRRCCANSFGLIGPLPSWPLGVGVHGTLDKRHLSIQIPRVIRNIRHKGLKRFYEDDDRRGVEAALSAKIARVLALLSRAAKPEDMALPGHRLHPLKGDLTGFWSVTIGANWRIIFRFEGADVTDVDLVDYH